MRKEKKITLFIIVIFMIFFLKPQVFASSDYVLPYPSFMPGSKLYIFSTVSEKLKKIWYFGSLAQFQYNLQLADKYLVEAKTLFEYDQYLLAHKALVKSDSYFKEAYPYLTRAASEGKDISEKVKIFQSAAEKHTEILEAILARVPEEFTWTPEKEAATKLYLKTDIQESIELRKSSL